MADQSQPQTSGSQTSTLIIPPEVQEKFGPLLELIAASESMNPEERQYWVNILPIMTPEQIGNLNDILSRERTQLAAIDAKYKSDAVVGNDPAIIASMESRIKTKKLEREQREREEANQEEVTEENLMSKIQAM